MTGSFEPSVHHAAAAAHHRSAARLHREASRHYRIGKDYAHAAHQALTAQGHALHALEHGHAASACYAAHEASKAPHYLNRLVGGAVADPAILNVMEHHAIAANHHDAACDHHVHAERSRDAEHFVRACYATKEALKHGKHALFHACQAAMHDAEHYGVHPSAELT